MMKKFLIAALVLALTACSSKKDIPELIQGDFYVKTIPSYTKYPAVNLNENNLKEILILLHYEINPEEIKGYFKITNDEYNERINTLFGNGLVKKNEEGNFIPTCMIIDEKQGNELKKLAKNFGADISEIFIDRLSRIKEDYQKNSSFKDIPFDNLSFFILGNVVLDEWQRKNIEENFVKAELPKRGEERYYLSVQRKDPAIDTEPFGIYSNKLTDFSDYSFGVYSNTKSEKNFLDLSREELINDFRMGKDENDTVFKKILVGELIELRDNPKRLVDNSHLSGFTKLGLVKDRQVTAIVINFSDDQKLSGLTSIITKDLLAYFENRRPLLIKNFLNSIYKNQTTFREWFMWVYKFIASEATDELISKGYIKMPTSRHASYILVNR